MPIQHAQLHWDDQGQPLSSAYDDVYFSLLSGLEETRYVFLQHNRLSERFAALHSGDCMTVGETGFGTGLNFLCCWQLFEQQAPEDAQLHFISVEKFPLTAADLQQALALWPPLQDYSEQLLQAYKNIRPGRQTLLFAGGRVRLTLLVGDASVQLAQLDKQIVDAWFLDGFAPAKNLRCGQKNSSACWHSCRPRVPPWPPLPVPVSCAGACRRQVLPCNATRALVSSGKCSAANCKARLWRHSNASRGSHAGF